MYHYKAKTLFNGMVAIPSKLVREGLRVTYNGQEMYLSRSNMPKFTKTYKDNWGRGEYTLCYFNWRPKDDKQHHFSSL